MARKRRGRRSIETPELDVTPFMNLMIVLVPVLLLSLVFTHTAVIELDFPSGDSAAGTDEPLFHLEVHIESDALVVADGRAVIRRIPVTQDSQHDFDALGDLMAEIKDQHPQKRDALVLLETDTSYQDLVSVLDQVRGTAATADGMSERFPVISLGDVPLAGAPGGES